MKEIIIVTGGANGLGLELVKQGLDRGLFVCNIDKDKEKMEELRLEFKENYKGFCGDVSDESFIINVINEIKGIGNITVLINNAGEPSFKLPTEYIKEDIDKCLRRGKRTGVLGAILLEDIFVFSHKGESKKNGRMYVSFYYEDREVPYVTIFSLTPKNLSERLDFKEEIVSLVDSFKLALYERR